VTRLLEEARIKRQQGSFQPIDNATIYRQMNCLQSILGVLRDNGVAVGPLNVAPARPPKEDPDAGLAEEEADSPDESKHASPEEASSFTRLPLYAGAAGWTKSEASQPGDIVFHSSLYWCPLIYLYSGLRRSEASAMSVDDIQIHDGVPYIQVRRHIVGTVGRGLKNSSSKRHVPIHSELVRLGLLEYAARIKDLGHEKLFPELINPYIARNDSGDMLYKRWHIIAAHSAFTLQPRPLHSLRGTFNAYLRKAGVRRDHCEELLGHADSSINTKYYTDLSRLKVKQQWVEQFATVTSHLPAVHDAALLPFVEAKEAAPWFRSR
jgi:integrase